MTKEICIMSILCPKTSEDFYHHIKCSKSTMNKRCSVKKRCSKRFRNIHRKAPVLESLFEEKYKPSGLELY